MLVIAEFEPETLTFSRIVSGNLGSNGEHQPFAFIEYEADAGAVGLRVALPDQTIRMSAPVTSNHFELYDFDFGSLIASTPHLAAPQRGFDTELLLGWADPAVPAFTNLGSFNFRFREETHHLNRQTLRYSITGPDRDQPPGSLWLDAGEANWRRLLRSQFVDCP